MNLINDNLTREQIAIMREDKSTVEHRRDYWTKEERQKLKEYYSAGYGISELAYMFQRTESAIFCQIMSMGLIEKTRSQQKTRQKCKCPQCPQYRDCRHREHSTNNAL